MDTIYESLRLAACALCRSLAHTLATCRYELSDRAVGKKHELFDKPVRFLCDLLVYIHRTSLLIDLNLHLRTVETDGSCCKSLLAKLGCKAMKNQNSICNLCRHTFVCHSRTGLDDHLSIFVCKTEVRVYCGLAEPLGNDASERSDLKHSRERKFLLIRTERTDLVAELLRKHRHSSVNQVH